MRESDYKSERRFKLPYDTVCAKMKAMKQPEIKVSLACTLLCLSRAYKGKVAMRKTGKRIKASYFCPSCQILYSQAI